MGRNNKNNRGNSSQRDRTPINEIDLKKARIENNIQSNIEKQNFTVIRKDNLKYNRTDKGPFHVIVEKQDLNLYKLSKELKLNRIDVELLDQINKRKAKLTFKIWHEANKLIDNELLKKNEYKCFIPEMYVHTVGVVRGLPIDITKEEIIENYQCSELLVSVERITRWLFDQNRSEDTETIKLTFRSRVLPEKIKIFDILSKIDYYIPNPIFCGKCLNFGHKKKFCQGQERCKVCSHASVDILEDQTEKPHECENISSCKHCGPGHKTNDTRLCHERKRQRKINRYMVINKVSYVEALKQFPKIKPKITFPNPDHNHFPNPTWNTNNVDQADKIEKLTEQKESLEEELSTLISFFKKIQQLVLHGSPHNASNDIILNDIGNECQIIIKKLKNKN